MFAECSLVMLAVSATLFFTSLMDKAPARALITIGLLLALAGLAILAWHRAIEWMYVGISLTAAAAGLVLPVISFLAVGASSQRLGSTMGGIAAAAGLGRTLGSGAGGRLFGSMAQLGFAWLALPLVMALSWTGRSMLGYRRVVHATQSATELRMRRVFSSFFMTRSSK